MRSNFRALNIFKRFLNQCFINFHIEIDDDIFQSLNYVIGGEKKLLTVILYIDLQFFTYLFLVYFQKYTFPFFTSKELTYLSEIFYMGLSKKDIAKKIMSNIHQKVINLFQLYIYRNITLLLTFFKFSTIL